MSKARNWRTWKKGAREYDRRTCRFCGYSGSDWGDSDECPYCGEVN